MLNAKILSEIENGNIPFPEEYLNTRVRVFYCEGRLPMSQSGFKLKEVVLTESGHFYSENLNFKGLKGYLIEDKKQTVIFYLGYVTYIEKCYRNLMLEVCNRFEKNNNNWIKHFWKKHLMIEI